MKPGRISKWQILQTIALCLGTGRKLYRTNSMQFLYTIWLELFQYSTRRGGEGSEMRGCLLAFQYTPDRPGARPAPNPVGDGDHAPECKEAAAKSIIFPPVQLYNMAPTLLYSDRSWMAWHRDPNTQEQIYIIPRMNPGNSHVLQLQSLTATGRLQSAENFRRRETRMTCWHDVTQVSYVTTGWRNVQVSAVGQYWLVWL